MTASGAPIWTKVTAMLHAEPEDWSVWAEVFAQHGLDGSVQTDDPPTISAYFPPGEEGSIEALIASLRSKGASDVTTEEVPETDWAESWKQFFKPTRIGSRIVVRPTWEAMQLAPEDLEIVLDPGQAFGTGDHPTTRMCLELLEQEKVSGSLVADIGCGSGILSIAAQKLGASQVVCVDLDPLSVAATRDNALRNGVALDTFVGKGFDPLPAGATYGIVVSNIISAALIGLAPEAAVRVAPGGVWIVSGIIRLNWPDVLARASSAGFQLKALKEEGEWVAATFHR